MNWLNWVSVVILAVAVGFMIDTIRLSRKTERIVKKMEGK